MAKPRAEYIVTRVKGINDDTILRCLREAAQHADQVEAVLMEK